LARRGEILLYGGRWGNRCAYVCHDTTNAFRCGVGYPHLDLPHPNCSLR
jgi:hypothetical protein